jgi:cytochrome c
MRRLALLSAIGIGALAASLHGQGKQFHLGHPPTPAQVRRWNITVLPDGAGLPPGSGTAAQGERMYRDTCSGCHGDRGQGVDQLGPQVAGGFGTLKSENPILTVGSYWPYATTVWDYIHRAMPYGRPGSLSANQTYALTAFLLYMNGIVKRNAVMDRETLPKVRMPNRHGFVPDPRPQIACSR